jgi:hypothetical protein
MPGDVIVELTSGQATAKKAASILVAKELGFLIPTALQRQNLLVAFAKRGKVVYGKAFDVIKVRGDINLDCLETVESELANITVYEIKSTRKALPADFSGYFFALTAAEVLVAQSLKLQFRFAFVNTQTGAHLELSLGEIFSRAKGIYPTWSIAF